MTIETMSKRVTIALRQWDNEAGCYGQNVFNDIETCFAVSHSRIPGDDALQATDEELDELIAWWEADVAATNQGMYTDSLGALSDDDLEAGNFWLLEVDEEQLEVDEEA